jgi:extracellular elastinolytic metalloproteinase
MKVIAVLLALLLGVLADERFEFVPGTNRNHYHNLPHGGFLTGPSTESPLDVATQFIESKLPGATYEITDNYKTKHNGVTHIYAKQTINGRTVLNAVLNINIDSQGRVVNMGENFYKGEKPEIAEPTIGPITAIMALAKKLDIPLKKKIQLVKFFVEKKEGIFTGGDFSLDEIPVKLVYVQNEMGSIDLSWHINVRRDENWYDASIDTKSGELTFLVDWFKGASYNVYPIGVNDPDDGNREIVTDPHLLSTGSPLGWHNQGDGEIQTVTIGNNVYAQENFDGLPAWENNYRPSGGNNLVFNFPIDFTEEPVEYIDAAVTNLFFWNNLIHDIFYEYGFDEVSGNFQENNFGNGGLGNDAVQANAQDGSGYNNANFATPPDGQRPRMRMYLWNQQRPMLDGDLDNGIIIHEYAHGISNRLAGGPANSNCMSGGQAGGMGEGHGDCFSLFFRWREEYNRNTVFGMGEYAAGRGIRLYPYAYNMTTNPQTYEYINGGQYSGVHAKGCAWCTFVYDFYLDMTEKYGFDADWYNGKGGNNVVLQLLTDGMKLGPCNPTFVDTRDAMVLADELNYSGTYSCDLWRAFARRGLGVNAVDTNNRVVDDFTVPVACR